MEISRQGASAIARNARDRAGFCVAGKIGCSIEMPLPFRLCREVRDLADRWAASAAEECATRASDAAPEMRPDNAGLITYPVDFHSAASATATPAASIATATDGIMAATRRPKHPRSAFGVRR